MTERKGDIPAPDFDQAVEPAVVNLDAGLTDVQRRLLDTVFYGHMGRNMRDVLAESDATNEDKAAVAEKLGVPGSGQEFLR